MTKQAQQQRLSAGTRTSQAAEVAAIRGRVRARVEASALATLETWRGVDLLDAIRNGQTFIWTPSRDSEVEHIGALLPRATAQQIPHAPGRPFDERHRDARGRSLTLARLVGEVAGTHELWVISASGQLSTIERQRIHRGVYIPRSR